jgi:uncharacterized 2Fe-2S/4Fe-4S cluster protein (DUF4445 family)
MSTNFVTIDFEPIGKRVDAGVGSSILEAAHSAGIDLTAVCGGAGTCLQCQVQVIAGQLALPNSVEKSVFSDAMIQEGWRLACQTAIHSSMKVHIPSDSLTTPQRLQVEGIAETLGAPSRFHIQEFSYRHDENKQANGNDSAPYDIFNNFPYRINPEQKGLRESLEKAILSAGNLRLIVHQDQILNFVLQKERVYGLAVDLGTTKIAAFLVDLELNQVAAKASASNPQIHYGEDIISRILYCMDHPDGQELMQKIVVDTLNQLIQQMLVEVKANARQIIEAALVGNTAMHHLFSGLPVKQLGLAPYLPASVTAMEIVAGDIGLGISPFGRIYLPENIAGYVGGDHVAMMLATQAAQRKDTVLAIDIGTNTEISLVHEGQIFSCSCASGPAFEGAHIKEGMRAAEGAIERIRMDGEHVAYQTIGNVPPIGICGSGILDAIAELVRNHLLDKRGNFTALQNIERNSHVKEFELVPAQKSGSNHAIVITKRDINEILLAKAAIQTGIEILLKTAGICSNDLDQVIIAGAFGTYLTISSAIQIGMFPNLPVSRFQQVGNAAGTGARMLLVSDEVRSQGTQLAGQTKYVELTLYPNFQEIYLNSLKFPSEEKQ